MDFDYTDCDQLTPQNTSVDSVTMDATLPSSKYTYKLRSADAKAPFVAPQYAFINRTGQANVTVDAYLQCVLQFDVPAELQTPVMLYYKLTNFYQNHRRYVKSLNQNQLRGDSVDVNSIGKGDCKPLGSIDGKIVYPCGLIANSLFNGMWSELNLWTGGKVNEPLTPSYADTFSNLTVPANSNSNSTSYIWSEKGIAWPGEAKKYATKPGNDISQVTPPPNWALRFPDGYTNDNIPNLKEDEHFQNWMRTAGLPTFTKLWGRNDDTKLAKGRYQIVINMSA